MDSHLLNFLNLTLEKFRFDDKRPIRRVINDAFEKADLILDSEKELVKVLREIDAHRYFVYVGFKSLMGFCNHSLRLSRTQSLRIVTMVRRPDVAQQDTPCAKGKDSEEYTLDWHRDHRKDWAEDPTESTHGHGKD